MSISITTADVKRKAMIASADTSHDSDITALITEMQPAIEREIDPASLSDTSDTGLQALLKLGILEIITGELLEQLMRESGAGETFAAAGITIGPALRIGPDLVLQGKARLAPYLVSSLDTARSNTSDTEALFNLEEEVW
jgi:hypothetical protein